MDAIVNIATGQHNGQYFCSYSYLTSVKSYWTFHFIVHNSIIFRG